jgi:hypothetical protein
MARAEAVAEHVRAGSAEKWSDLVERFGKSAVLTAIRHRLIASVLPGIYGVSAPESLFRVRARAATLLAAPTGTITGLAAAHLWRIVDAEPSHITVQVPVEWRRTVPRWLRTVRVGAPANRFRLGGIRVASAADAAVQVWREARPDVAISTVIKAFIDQHATKRQLLEALARRKRIPRRAQLEELITIVGTVVTSYLEYVAWKRVFPPRLFPDLKWQEPVWPRGRKRVMDAFDAEARIDLEFDGGGTHGGVDGFERDRERDADLRSIGIEPLHFTYRDLTERPEWCRQQYLALRAERLRRFGASGN